MTAFQMVISGRTDCVLDYLKDGGSPMAHDQQGVTLIQWCAYYGDTTAVKHLVYRGCSLDSLGHNLGLNDACFHGHWQLCQFLIESGADVNFADQDTGETPLHLALCKANRPVYSRIVSLLLAHAANPNAKTKPNQKLGSFMRDCKSMGETPLHRAAAFADEATISLMLSEGANKETRDASGDSPLAWASWHLRPAAILRLLCFGEHQIHPGNSTNYDHGYGWHLLDPPHGELRMK